ncbi:MAG: FAD-binding dehydrogenase [Deltaproteobacteria bacterium]|nr:FAD-binding dehydrogenase [Deltaproteobacteria bacterium]
MPDDDRDPSHETERSAAGGAPELSRRRFLGGAASGLALGTAGALGCAPSSSPEPARWDLETDVVLVGTGTGLVGGLTAAVAGAEVVALEKRSIVGGSTGHSGGVAWIPNNNVMRAENIEDSRERALTYLTHLAQSQADPELLEAFVDAGPEMADFVQAHSSIEWRVSTIMGDNADYHPEWPGALQRGRSIEPVVEREGLFGPELIEYLRRGFEAAGGRVLTETPVERLVLREREDGVREVIGVEARRDGAPFFVLARRGVHLAAGGFEWDFDMKRHFLRGPTPYTLGAGGNTGDGVRMAMAAGADLRNMNEIWGISVYKGEAEPAVEHRMGATLNAELEKRSAGSIVVNTRGERFQDEAADYDSTWRSYHTWENWGEMGYRNLPAFLLFDAKPRRNGRIAGAGPDDPLPDFVSEAASLGELAEKLGIDAQGLTRTVARFNVYAAELRDPDFHRGESSYDRYGQADKGITLAPLDEPPFFGAEISAADLGTCGGARVNGRAQVLDPFGQAIPGLFASGNNAGVGSPGSSYGGGGGTIGPAMAFAYLAGRELAKQPSRSG